MEGFNCLQCVFCGLCSVTDQGGKMNASQASSEEPARETHFSRTVFWCRTDCRGNYHFKVGYPLNWILRFEFLVYDC